MLKGQCVILTKNINGKVFTNKCLKQIAKDNAKLAYKIGNNTGIIRNFRYNNKRVIADFAFPYLDINMAGSIDECKEGFNNVSKFTIKTIELIQKNTKM